MTPTMATTFSTHPSSPGATANKGIPFPAKRRIVSASHVDRLRKKFLNNIASSNASPNLETLNSENIPPVPPRVPPKGPMLPHTPQRSSSLKTSFRSPTPDGDEGFTDLEAKQRRRKVVINSPPAHLTQTPIHRQPPTPLPASPYTPLPRGRKPAEPHPDASNDIRDRHDQTGSTKPYPTETIPTSFILAVDPNWDGATGEDADMYIFAQEGFDGEGDGVPEDCVTLDEILKKFHPQTDRGREVSN
ncbi:hypothetical protein K474DRAFT_1770739 [Panus rudis PR-1116 ss-1]|nr:hypothetical protein K474DRAFT_1770739 [Panus rudis PR-1116 ss-1]